MTFNQSRSYTHGRLPTNYFPSRYYFTDQPHGNQNRKYLPYVELLNDLIFHGFVFKIVLNLDRTNASLLANNILPDVYPQSQSNPSDLSRAFRVDAHLLAIIRIEDKRSSFRTFFFFVLFNENVSFLLPS